jgi:tryptophan-rich sensory protein
MTIIIIIMNLISTPTNYNLKYLLYLLAPNLISSAVSAYAGRVPSGPDFNQSPLTPPPWTFGVVWPILYTSIGHVLYQLFETPSVNPSRNLLILNLVLNFFWLITFNKDQNYSLSWWLIILMLLSLVAFFLTNPQTNLSLILVPYFLWLSFASYLNYYVWKNN